MTREELLEEYKKINNSFKEKVIYHVGIDGGFHSEVDAMMECMLYCYVHKIKFVLYSEDANFAGGNGWTEFFEPFCEETHGSLNRIANGRYPASYYGIRYHLLRRILKIISGAKYLTSDIFGKAITKEYGWTKNVKWDLFDVDGTIHDEFAKLSSIALCYNKKTKQEVEDIIHSIDLPDSYYSIQFRGGDKTLEQEEYMRTEDVVNRIEEYGINIENIFVFSDDYRYIEELKDMRPNWKIYTMVEKEEQGYNNEEFQKLDWSKKRQKMVRLFAQIEICLRSKMHLGYEFSCTNNYIRSIRKPEEYFAIVANPELGRKSALEIF